MRGLSEGKTTRKWPWVYNGAWCATVHGVAKSQTRLSDWTMTTRQREAPVLCMRLLAEQTRDPCPHPKWLSVHSTHRLLCPFLFRDSFGCKAGGWVLISFLPLSTCYLIFKKDQPGRWRKHVYTIASLKYWECEKHDQEFRNGYK